MDHPEKDDRDGVMVTQEQVDALVQYDKPGAFDHFSNKPLVNAGSRPRFGWTKPETVGEPANLLLSDFDNVVANSKPSASVMVGGQRLKNDTVSYGDPGAVEIQACVIGMPWRSRLPDKGFVSSDILFFFRNLDNFANIFCCLFVELHFWQTQAENEAARVAALCE